MIYSSTCDVSYQYQIPNRLSEIEYKIIELIKNGSLTSELSEYIHRVIDSTINKDITIDLITSRGIDVDHAHQIFDGAVKHDNYKELQKLLINGINFDTIEHYGNVKEHLQIPGGLNNGFFEWLYNFRPAVGGVQTGAGEYFLRLVFACGRTPAHGDLRVAESDIEVKSTQNKKSGFRMKGQCGYGNGHSSLLTALETIGIDHSNFEHSDYQLFFKNKESHIQSILRGYSTEDHVNFYMTYLSENYIHALSWVDRDNKISRAIASSINLWNVLDTDYFMPYLAALEFSYYAHLENWDYFMTINHMKDYLILDSDLSYPELVNIFTEYFKFTSLPNTKCNSTPQDSVLGVTLK